MEPKFYLVYQSNVFGPGKKIKKKNFRAIFLDTRTLIYVKKTSLLVKLLKITKDERLFDEKFDRLLSTKISNDFIAQRTEIQTQTTQSYL